MTRTRALARLARRFWADEGGATAIEYALIAAGVGAAIAATVVAVGDRMEEVYYNKLDSVIQ